MTNPETGAYHYVYDSDPICGTSKGDLVKRTDAMPSPTVTCYASDALHRVTSITYPSGAYASVTPAKYFVYDAATISGNAMLNAKGRLAEAYTGASKTTDLGFSYSARGELTDVWQKSTNSGGYYHVAAGYWPTGPQGLVKTLSLLNASNQPLSGLPTWTYNPDGEGRIASVTASGSQTAVASTGYNVFSLPTTVTLGSGDSDSFGYDGNTGRMTSYNTALGVSPWATLAVSGPQSGASYYQTDSFTVTVHGAANAAVSVALGSGATCSGATQLGTTNSSGDWSTSSTWNSSNVGSYVELWCVAGVAATPTLNFSVVSSTPTPAGPTPSLLGPSTSSTLTWNANGSLGKVAAMDGFNGGNAKTCAYTHDDLGRLGQVDCGPSWGQGFSYDPFGNINWTTLSGHTGSVFTNYGYNPLTNRFTGTGPSYDNNGNLLYDGAHYYLWDAEGNMVQVSDATTTTTILYDALGRRVDQNDSSARTLLYGPDGSKLAVMSGQTVSKALVPLPGGATAVYNSAGQLAWYRHPDWLGSSRIASTPGTRTMYYDGAYSPFGETIAEAGTADRNFTGQNQDARPDLYDFTYRDYHAAHGRWISPDPAGMGAVDPSNPQSWNRYAYVSNNPLASVDPDGQVPAPPYEFFTNLTLTAPGTGPLAPIMFAIDVLEWIFGWGDSSPSYQPPAPPSAPPALGGAYDIGFRLYAQGTTQGQVSKKPCDDLKAGYNRSRFFQHLPELTAVARSLNLPPVYVVALSSYESGWLDDHNVKLNNLWGLTQNGGNNIPWSSYQAGTNYFVRRVGPFINGKFTVEGFFAGLKREGFNPSPSYYSMDPTKNNLYSRILNIQQWATRCGTPF